MWKLKNTVTTVEAAAAAAETALAAASSSISNNMCMAGLKSISTTYSRACV